MDRKRLLLGLALAAVGVVIARGNQWLLGDGSPHLLVAYVVGVGIALAGLVVVGSSLGKSYEQVVQCPECLALNPADAEQCAKCLQPIKRLDERE